MSSATKRHKKHKMISSVLCLLCLFCGYKDLRGLMIRLPARLSLTTATAMVPTAEAAAITTEAASFIV